MLNLIQNRQGYLSILSICAVPVSLTYIFGSLMTAGGKLLQLNIVAGVTLIINLSLNLTLIPAWGITGAAVATITAQLFAATAQIIFCIRYYKFKPDKNNILNMVFM
ncbi:MAG: hypothetical protein HC830_02845 [Bacteroidetes bacterium]|nr:hypothetical protein [Bacteroidota bacterium]